MKDPLPDLVVVIEDDPRLSAALEVLVNSWGFRCLLVRTPSEAMAALGSGTRQVCAVIVDQEIDLRGRADRSARLLAEATGQLVPVLLTTTDTAVVEHEPGVTVLAKPFDPEMVRSWLMKTVGRPSAGKACA